MLLFGVKPNVTIKEVRMTNRKISKREKKNSTKLNSGKQAVKRNHKDTVFKGLFSQPRYQLELVKALGLGDETLTEDDISLVTLNRIITKGIQNDLGLMVREKILMLTEAQSSWSDNIVLRQLFYSVSTYHDHIYRTGQDLFAEKAIEIPRIELFVIYSGDKKDVPEYLSLKEKFFDGVESSIEVKVTVISRDDPRHRDDIIGQYIKYTEISREVLAKNGNNYESLEKIVERCITEEVLADYMKSLEPEVKRDMFKS